ncbi:MAG: A/G-specific adenine glycosylase [Lacticaseibacillus songhuajiangensis]|jgi:A/G-specific adenine glycosylase|nr:A/G-specific adenine glycosylase [Lacticaseibacillus songhuajiangensis]
MDNKTNHIVWTDDQIADFRQTLLAWYDAEKRDLPWRRDQDPYHVMVSEIMLQQTQVQTVIPYYERFLTAFPTVQALADAPEAQVMKAWEGLGYYSRARNLQKAAQQVAHERGGEWPRTAAGLSELRGIGPYTAGAIASIAFGEAEPAIDGNAFRVFARLLCIPDDITKPKTRQVFDCVIRRIIDPARPGDFNQAIMDLGSSYMAAKNPDPAHSPVARFDASYITDRVLDYPVKTKKPRPVPVDYFAIAVHSEAGWLMTPRPADGLLGGMLMWPLIQKEGLVDIAASSDVAAANAVLSAALGTQLQLLDAGVPIVKHTFTHRQWRLQILRADVQAFTPQDSDYQWADAATLAANSLPTVQKKLFRALE